MISMSKEYDKSDIKKFLIKLAAITFAIIIIINVTYNLIFAEKLENINKLIMLNKKENIDSVKDKIRVEIEKGLSKEKILDEEDKILIYKLYLKIKKEFQEIENK
tara:strand:+ start:327 stop:641 length:315 start_codon:yes stop_codon:yes gene_type:complete